MKTPNYIYTYFTEPCRGVSGAVKHDIRVYEPRTLNKRLKLGDELFSLEAMSNTDKDYGRGLRNAYGVSVENLRLERQSSVALVAKLAKAFVKNNNHGIPEIIRELKRLGAVRFALGKVEDPQSYNGKEFMPRKYAGKKSVPYWNAIKAGLELPL
jgi:hypothetical protein